VSAPRVSLRRGERGYSMVALMAAVGIMLVLLAAATPSWRYLIRNDREEELLFRGGEIADAIQRYQRKNGNALPASLEVLVKGRFLRRAYKDPLTRDGRWRFLKPGDVLGAPGGLVPRPGGSPFGTTTTTTTTTTRPSAFSQPTTIIGGFQGVASTSTETSLRMVNGRTKYSEWVFIPGQQRVIGRPAGGPGRPEGLMPPTRPGVTGGAGGLAGGGLSQNPNLAPAPPPE
jgi:type II secretory pathway pseudopilin PulG